MKKIWDFIGSISIGYVYISFVVLFILSVVATLFDLDWYYPLLIGCIITIGLPVLYVLINFIINKWE